MRIRDDIALVQRVFGWVLPLTGLVAFIYWAVAYVYTALYGDPSQMMAWVVLQVALIEWPYFLVGFLLVVIWALYRELKPRVEIVFEDGPRFRMRTEEGVVYYKVDLINFGDHQDNVSFRLDHVRDETGSYMPIDRRGFEREGGRGTMPLGNSAKAAYIVSMDESDTASRIYIRTVATEEEGYTEQPLAITRGTYFLDVSLNPRIGRPCCRTFRVFVNSGGHLRMEEATHVPRPAS